MNQMATILMREGPSEFKTVIPKVLTDRATVGRIYNCIWRNLRNKRILDRELRGIFCLLNLLLCSSDLFVRYRKQRGDYYKTIAIALQRQCCSGENRAEFLGIMTEGFRAIWWITSRLALLRTIDDTVFITKYFSKRRGGIYPRFRPAVPVCNGLRRAHNTDRWKDIHTCLQRSRYRLGAFWYASYLSGSFEHT